MSCTSCPRRESCTLPLGCAHTARPDARGTHREGRDRSTALHMGDHTLTPKGADMTVDATMTSEGSKAEQGSKRRDHGIKASRHQGTKAPRHQGTRASCQGIKASRAKTATLTFTQGNWS